MISPSPPSDFFLISLPQGSVCQFKNFFFPPYSWKKIKILRKKKEEGAGGRNRERMEMPAMTKKEDRMEKTRIIVQKCKNEFTFNEFNQASFCEYFMDRWYALDFAEINKKQRRCYATPRKRGEKMTEAIYVPIAPGSKPIRLILPTHAFEDILEAILGRSSWVHSVKRVIQIPSAMVQAILTCKGSLRSFFPSLEDGMDEDEDKQWLNSVINTVRYEYHSKVRHLGTAEEEYDECDYASHGDTSSSDTEGASSSLEDAIAYYDALHRWVEGEILMEENDAVVVRRIVEQKTENDMETETTNLGMHPYSLSCAIFAMCVQLEGFPDSWPASRSYLYVKDYLSDQVPVYNGPSLPPLGVRKLARELLLSLSSPFRENKNRLHSLVSYFRDAHGMIVKHRRRHKYIRDCTFNGYLEPFQMHSKEELLSGFYAYHPPTPTREPSSFHCQCGKTDCTSVVISFDRGRVSPLQLHTSLDMIDRKFNHVDQHLIAQQLHQRWSIAFTRERTYLMIEKQLFDKMRNECVLYLIMEKNSILRTVPVPCYYAHVYNYFNGSEYGLYTSMRFLLSCFSRSGLSKAKYLPQSPADPVVHGYRLLHLILDRCKDPETLQQHILNCLRERAVVVQPGGQITSPTHSKKRGYEHIPRNEDSFFAAITAFVLPYAPHYITYYALDALWNRIRNDTVLRDANPLLYRLVEKLARDADKFYDADASFQVPIPEDVLKNTVDPETGEDEGVIEYPYPPHLLLYELCASKQVLSDPDAWDLFLNIGCKERVKEQGVTFSSKIILARPVKRARRAARERYRIHYEVTLMAGGDGSTKAHKAYALCDLFQMLEELSYVTKRADRVHFSERNVMVPMKPETVFSYAPEPPPFPVDFSSSTGEGIRFGMCLPVWKSCIYDASYRTMGAVNHSQNVGISSILFNELDARPFWGCHEDMLECVILQPIFFIEAMREAPGADIHVNRYIPADLRDELSISDSPEQQCDSPIDRKIRGFSNQFFSVYEDRKGWNYRPSLLNLLNLVLRT